MKKSQPTSPIGLPPFELRKTFGRNLRRLTEPYRSISSLCRDIGINRTQFNRYLSGESFPRPEVLQQICTFFGVSTDTLLGTPEPAFSTCHPFLEGFATHPASVPEALFPSGIYHFTRGSLLDTEMILSGLVQVSRQEGATCVRGFASRNMMRHLSLPTNSTVREFRGIVVPQDAGVFFTLSHRENNGNQFVYLSATSAPEPDLWVGFAARPEHSGQLKQRVAHLVFERLEGGFAQLRARARKSGYIAPEDAPARHLPYLRLGKTFA